MIATHYTYWIIFSLMMIGLYAVMSHGNLVKKLIGLNIFQVAVFMFFISLGRVDGGSPPIITEGIEVYSHPLPHVLILTAIVVGVATTSVGVAIAIRIYEAYGTVEEDNALARDAAEEGTQ
ncbi:MAG TPA: cation:proton antiporter subunit C [Jiangellaceae bacterium]|nr:cation:proton antiporter subunit C [Jiangellaceae bacterium]